MSNVKQQFTHWCITWNNPVPTAEAVLEKLTVKCNYAVFQLEKGESGTQIFCESFLRSPSVLFLKRKYFNPRRYTSLTPIILFYFLFCI